MGGKLRVKFDFSIFIASLLFLMIVLYSTSSYSFNRSVNDIYYLDYGGNFFLRVRENIFIASLLFLNILISHCMQKRTIDSGNIYKYIRNRNIGRYYSKHISYILAYSLLFVAVINGILFLCIGTIDLGRGLLSMVCLLLFISMINMLISIMITCRINDNYCIGLPFLISMSINSEVFSGIFSQEFVKAKVLIYCLACLVMLVILAFMNRAVLGRREFY